MMIRMDLKRFPSSLKKGELDNKSNNYLEYVFYMFQLQEAQTKPICQ